MNNDRGATKNRSAKSLQLYRTMLRMGYPDAFCLLVSGELNTDFTASQLLGYLRYCPDASPEDVADELLAILSRRESIVNRKKAIHAQRTINEVCRYGLDASEEEEIP